MGPEQHNKAEKDYWLLLLSDRDRCRNEQRRVKVLAGVHIVRDKELQSNREKGAV